MININKLRLDYQNAKDGPDRHQLFNEVVDRLEGLQRAVGVASDDIYITDGNKKITLSEIIEKYIDELSQ